LRYPYEWVLTVGRGLQEIEFGELQVQMILHGADPKKVLDMKLPAPEKEKKDPKKWKGQRWARDIEALGFKYVRKGKPKEAQEGPKGK
jgi:hypothetical protein